MIRKPSKSIHKALDLPSSYRISVSVEGHIETEHFALREMGSSVGGHVHVWALSKNWGDWEEITSTAFINLSQLILGIWGAKVKPRASKPGSATENPQAPVLQSVPQAE